MVSLNVSSMPLTFDNEASVAVAASAYFNCYYYCYYVQYKYTYNNIKKDNLNLNK